MSPPQTRQTPARMHGLGAWLCAALMLAPAVRAEDVRDIERLFRAGESASALERAQKSVSARPRDAAMRFLLGVMYAESGRQADAADVFLRLTEDFPDLPEPYNNLAVLRAAEGRIDHARELLEAALRHDPAYLAAHENLGDIYIRLALRAYERVSGSASNQPVLERKLRLVRELVYTGRP